MAIIRMKIVGKGVLKKGIPADNRVLVGDDNEARDVG